MKEIAKFLVVILGLVLLVVLVPGMYGGFQETVDERDAVHKSGMDDGTDIGVSMGGYAPVVLTGIVAYLTYNHLTRVGG